MGNSFVDDLDIVDQSTVENSGANYPAAQWLHGDPKLAAAGGVGHTGGIILPGKYLDDSIAPAPGWTRATVAFSSGKSEAVLAVQRARLAIVRTRFRWFAVQNGREVHYPRDAYVADSGMRGHLQVLCGVHGFDFPIAVTFKGKASQEFDRMLRDFTAKIQEAAARITREKGGAEQAAKFPRFAFYMRIVPGPHVKVGQKGQESIITPPVLELPAVLGEDYLSKVYVGRDKLVELQELYHEAEAWAGAWGKIIPGEGEEDEIYPDEETAGLHSGERDNPPASQKAASTPAPAQAQKAPAPAAKPHQEAPKAATTPAKTPPPAAEAPAGKPKAKVTGFIQDIESWRTLLEWAKANGVQDSREVQPILKAAGWTEYTADKFEAAKKTVLDAPAF